MLDAVGDDARRRLTVSEAADALGITVDAVRGRIRRGTVETVRDQGRVFVVLDADQSTTEHDQDSDQYGESNPLISQLRSEIEYLREENRRKDEIIMQQALTVRQLTAASEVPSESPEPRPEEPTPTETGGGAEEGTERRSWLYRFFFRP